MMDLISASHPVWANAASTAITLLATFDGTEEMPFTASSEDTADYGRAIFARAAAGEFGEISPYVVPLGSVPASITRRQCAAELFDRALITGPEAVAMVATATPPAMVETAIGALAEPAQTHARIDFAASSYERGNALFAQIMGALGETSSDVDAFFRAAAAR